MSDLLAPKNQFNTFQTEKSMAAKYFSAAPSLLEEEAGFKVPSQAARQPPAALIALRTFCPQCLPPSFYLVALALIPGRSESACGTGGQGRVHIACKSVWLLAGRVRQPLLHSFSIHSAEKYSLPCRSSACILSRSSLSSEGTHSVLFTLPTPTGFGMLCSWTPRSHVRNGVPTHSLLSSLGSSSLTQGNFRDSL